MRIGQAGRPLHLGGIKWDDPDAVTSAIEGQRSPGETIYALVLDGTDLELYPVEDAGDFVQDVTDGHQFPDLTVTFYALLRGDHETAQALLAERKLNPV